MGIFQLLAQASLLQVSTCCTCINHQVYVLHMHIPANTKHSHSVPVGIMFGLGCDQLDHLSGHCHLDSVAVKCSIRQLLKWLEIRTTIYGEITVYRCLLSSCTWIFQSADQTMQFVTHNPHMFNGLVTRINFYFRSAGADNRC